MSKKFSWNMFFIAFLSRRMIGFLVSSVASVMEPSIAPFMAVLYGALVGASISDNMTDNKKSKEIKESDL